MCVEVPDDINLYELNMYYLTLPDFNRDNNLSYRKESMFQFSSSAQSSASPDDVKFDGDTEMQDDLLLYIDNLGYEEPASNGGASTFGIAHPKVGDTIFKINKATWTWTYYYNNGSTPYGYAYFSYDFVGIPDTVYTSFLYWDITIQYPWESGSSGFNAQFLLSKALVVAYKPVGGATWIYSENDGPYMQTELLLGSNEPNSFFTKQSWDIQEAGKTAINWKALVAFVPKSYGGSVFSRVLSFINPQPGSTAKSYLFETTLAKQIERYGNPIRALSVKNNNSLKRSNDRIILNSTVVGYYYLEWKYVFTCNAF